MGEKSGGRLCNIAKYFAIQKKVKKKIIRGRTHQKRVGAGNARCKGKGGGGGGVGPSCATRLSPLMQKKNRHPTIDFILKYS